MNHELIKEMSVKDRRALCIVVGLIKTTKDTKITASLNFKVDADVKVVFRLVKCSMLCTSIGIRFLCDLALTRY